MMKRKARRKGNRISIIIIIVFILFASWFFIDANVKVNTEIKIIEVGSEYFPNKEVATFMGNDVSRFVNVSGTVDSNTIGEYSVTYLSFLFSEKYERIIKVIDNKPPEIELIGEKIIYIENLDSYNEPGVIAKDNYDGDISTSVEIDILEKEENIYEIIYTSIDSSGNQSTVKRILKKYAGTVYLTFDDGPSLKNTPAILDILKENNVTATFFVIGYDESKADIIKRMVNEGHTIGLHGMSHTYSEIYSSVDATMNNFYELDKLIRDTTNGYSSKIIRFPGGSSNTISKNYCEGIMTEATKRAIEEGYKYFDWNVDSLDAGGAKTAEDIYQNVIGGIKPNRNNVVLMHDAGAKENTVLALERIVDYCLENDFQVIAIDSVTPEVHHSVSN